MIYTVDLNQFASDLHFYFKHAVVLQDVLIMIKPKSLPMWRQNIEALVWIEYL